MKLDVYRLGELLGEIRGLGQREQACPLERPEIDRRVSEITTEIMDHWRRVDAALVTQCDCGGSGPGEGCLACEIYHRIHRPEFYEGKS